MSLGTIVEDGDAVHVMPIGDLREHDSSCDCWCKPKADPSAPDVIVHNSIDGREEYEAGERLLH